MVLKMCVKNVWQKVIVYMFSLIYIFLDFHLKSNVFLKLQYTID